MPVDGSDYNMMRTLRMNAINESIIDMMRALKMMQLMNPSLT